ncbi:RraA family protein [Herbaspirillum sp. RTI4]|uniref:RraA family protein n=1 Tax=Herbaspirillum sp. RTI4 TaxID=3048640 RepID=UPI002AB420AE|nr:RraA family protein [Herbaspirillum sp. RTI4]MDY7578767.1 RraA family protein [Herbaspirillum sp. RTI4]MEA9982313.1 RraA family protein [Herbaspirillum sp. RTI4]
MLNHQSFPFVKRLECCYSGILHDVMRAAGLRNFTLPPTLRPLIPGQKLCGPAFTVSGRVSISSDAHETLVQWTGMLSQAKSGHVLVIQPNDSTVAHMGELSSETLKLKGVRGVIADGGVRDAEFIIGLGFQVWHRYFTPRDVVDCWLPDAIDQPVTIGEVSISPGDYLFGDLDGLIRIPKEAIESTLRLAEAAMAQENKVRTAILEGIDPQEAYLKYGKF